MNIKFNRNQKIRQIFKRKFAKSQSCHSFFNRSTDKTCTLFCTTMANSVSKMSAAAKKKATKKTVVAKKNIKKAAPSARKNASAAKASSSKVASSSSKPLKAPSSQKMAAVHKQKMKASEKALKKILANNKKVKIYIEKRRKKVFIIRLEILWRL